MRIISPVMRTPLSDLGASMINHQQFSECANRELDMVECLEAYGYDRGKKKCERLIADFYECESMKKQYKRICAMRLERERQIRAGILKGDQKYIKTPPLSF